MTRQLYALLGICLFMTITGHTQTFSVKGSVTDTLNKTAMQNAVVYLKNPKDSSLIVFTRSDSKGQFELAKLQPGNYIMVVSYPTYVDWIDSISVHNASPAAIPVFLTTKAHLLQEVIVRQTIPPIRVKGDTTEYLADSFRVKPGATVEDLLKILPGISVNSKGEITAQGQKVQKVLVDGDEFFGDDPTMATQNLNAKDVAKVQVFDKKSDQSTLTGIDDGSKEKTVNLILKEDAKKGYFGNATAGTDFNKYYQGKISANRFTSTLKAGALITVDRTGRNGMNWEEMQDYGNINANVENGNVSFSWVGDNDFDTWDQEGIPENQQFAGMLNKKFGARKSSTANNFSHNRLKMAGDGNTNSTYILRDTIRYNNQSRSFSNNRWKNNISTKNEINIDSLTTITINAKLSNGKNRSFSTQDGEYLDEKLDTINRNHRVNATIGETNSSKADIFLRRKLNAAGTRSFTLSTGIGNNRSETEGFLANQTDYFTNGTPSAQQVVDQRKSGTNTSKTVQALASYTEPFNNKLSLNINYTYNSSNSEQNIRSYEKRNDKYDSLNLLFSNHFRFLNASHRGGFTLNYLTKKINAKLGMAMQDLELKQTNMYRDSSFTKNFTNFFPTASVHWKFSSSGSINFNYRGYTKQPSLSALQPIIDNTDPLNLVIGNANLRPVFTHNISFTVSDYKTLSKRGIWSWGGVNFHNNDFASRRIVDAQGKSTTQTVNVNGNYNLFWGVDMSQTIQFLKIDMGIEPYISYGRNKNYVNGQENTTRRITFTQRIYVRKYIEKKLNADFSYNASYNRSVSTINEAAATKYWTQSLNGDFEYKLPKDWTLGTEIVYDYRQKISATDKNNNVVVWNFTTAKKILKKQDVTLELRINDILNQRIGFDRNIHSNYITENRYTTIQRYAMLSLRWKFNKNRKSDEDEVEDE